MSSTYSVPNKPKFIIVHYDLSDVTRVQPFEIGMFLNSGGLFHAFKREIQNP